MTEVRPLSASASYSGGDRKSVERACLSAHLLHAIANLRRLAARILLVLLGGGAIVWGASTLPMFWRQANLQRIAGLLMERDTFRPGALDSLIPQMEAVEPADTCRPEALRSAAIILAAGGGCPGGWCPPGDRWPARVAAGHDFGSRSPARPPIHSFGWSWLGSMGRAKPFGRSRCSICGSPISAIRTKGGSPRAAQPLRVDDIRTALAGLGRIPSR